MKIKRVLAIVLAAEMAIVSLPVRTAYATETMGNATMEEEHTGDTSADSDAPYDNSVSGDETDTYASETEEGSHIVSINKTEQDESLAPDVEVDGELLESSYEKEEAALGSGEQEYTLGSQMSGTIPTGKNGTWCRIVLDKSYMLKLSHSNDMFIYKQDKSESLWDAWGIDKTEYGCLLKGTYYAWIKGSGGSTYTFTLSPVKEDEYYQSSMEDFDDPSTRNDTKENANEYDYSKGNSGFTIHGLCGYNNNVDWYRLSLSAPVILTFNYTNYGYNGIDENYKPTFTVYKGADEIFHEGLSFPRTSDVLRGDNYFIRVEKYNYAYNSSNFHSYEIVVSPADISVSYDTNGAPADLVRTPDPVPCDNGDVVTVKDICDGDEIAKVNFLGWSENKNSTVPEYKKGSKITISDHDVTLYAIWKKPWDFVDLDPDVYHPEPTGGATSFYKVELKELEGGLINLSLELKSALKEPYGTFALYNETGKRLKLSNNVGLPFDSSIDANNYKMIFRRIGLAPGTYYISVQEKNSDDWNLGLSAEYGIYVTTYRAGDGWFDLTKDSLPLLNIYQSYDLKHKKNKDGKTISYIPTQYWKDVIKSFDVRLYNLDDSIFQRQWNGYCFGQAAVAMNVFEQIISVPQSFLDVHKSLNPQIWISDDKNTLNKSDSYYTDYNDSFPKLNKNIIGDQEIRRLIADYQIWHSSKEGQEWMDAYVRKYNDSNNENRINYTEFKNEVDNKKTLIITVIYSGGGHTLLVDGCRELLNAPEGQKGWVRYYLCDSNYPFYEPLTSNGAVYYETAENRWIDINTNTGEWKMLLVSKNAETKASRSIDSSNSRIFIQDTGSTIDGKEYFIPTSFNGTCSYMPSSYPELYGSLAYTCVKQLSPTLRFVMWTSDKTKKLIECKNGEEVFADDSIVKSIISGESENTTDYSYILNGSDYYIELDSGCIELITNKGYIRINSSDSIKFGVESSAITDMVSEKPTSVDVIVAEVDYENETYQKIITSINSTSNPTDIIVQDGKTTIDSSQEQTIDLGLETESGEGSIEKISTDNINGLEIKDNVKEVFSIDKATVKSVTYNGKVQGPKVLYDGKVLKEKVDYTWTKLESKKNYTNAGTYKVKLVGKGKYSGTANKSYSIKAKAITPTVSLSAKAYTYNGKVIKPAVAVKNGKTKLKTSDYRVTYASGRKNVGTYKVSVKLRGNYSGGKTVSFKINPKGTSLSRLSSAKKAIIVKWKQQTAKMSTARITGYQIQLATDSKFTKNKKAVAVKGYNKTSKEVGNLKGGVKYYVRIRTYRVINGTNYYSPWSKAKAVTTKK